VTAAPYAPNVAAIPHPPFIQHLREMTSGAKKLPETQARKHHYVPSFLLARWAMPQARDGRLFSLEVSSGKVTQQKPGKVALKKDLYTLDRYAKTVDLAIEAFLSVIEGHASDPIKRPGAAPGALSDDDRATIAFFLALQQGRTPTGLGQHGQVAHAATEASLHAVFRDKHAAAEASLHAVFRDKQAVAARYREKIDASASDDEIKAWAIEQIKAFRDGRATITLPDAAPFQAMLNADHLGRRRLRI
jgi:hypothetical protein